MRVAAKIAHPSSDAPTSSLEVKKLKQNGIAPILCVLKLSSWVPSGKLDKIVIKHEFRITLIQGQINIKDNFASMDFSKGNESEANITDLDDEQDKALN